MNYQQRQRRLQEIKDRVRIVDYARVMGYTVIKSGSYYSLKEHDSVRIDDKRNHYWRNSNGTNGDIIDFVMNMSRPDGPPLNMNTAFNELNAYLGGDTTIPQRITPRPAAPTHKKTELRLPPAADTTETVYNYLVNERCLSSNIVNKLFLEKVIYEDKQHCCVFVGRNKEHQPVFCMQRNPSKNHAEAFREFAGNDYSEGIYLNYNSDCLIIAEGAISGLSVATLLEKNGRVMSENNYLFLGGVSKLKAAFKHIEQDSPSTVVLAFDNDEAGRGAVSKMIEELHKQGYKGKVIPFLPRGEGLDWNDKLKQHCRQIEQKKTQNIGKER